MNNCSRVTRVCSRMRRAESAQPVSESPSTNPHGCQISPVRATIASATKSVGMESAALIKLLSRSPNQFLFQPALTYAQLDTLFAGGAQLKSTSITQEFTYEDFQKQHPGTAVSLCLLQKTGKLTIFSADTDLVPKPGDTLISLLTVPEQQTIVENGMSKNIKAKQIVAEKKSSRGEKLPATL